ncbi:MAG: nucleotidyltransferase domain-containing protein [bacterium]|nr:nucleotidyltransferase domain-containing protein [bacterium]
MLISLTNYRTKDIGPKGQLINLVKYVPNYIKRCEIHCPAGYLSQRYLPGSFGAWFLYHIVIEKDPNRDYIQSISLFGSVLHGDNQDDSDIDLLIEPRKAMGFFKLVEIQLNLEKELGHRVDLVTRKSISKHFRDKVIDEAEKVYDHA